MKTISRSLLAGLFLLVLTSCARFAGGPVAQPTAAPSVTPPGLAFEPTSALIVPTETEPPTPTPAASATPSATPTAFITPEVPSNVTANNVRLRAGPGMLFEAVDVLVKGSSITVLGRATGDDWLYVDSRLGQGWISAAYTSLFQSDQLASLPVKDTGDAVVVKGHVAYSGDGPFGGVEFAIYKDIRYQDVGSTPPDALAHSLPDGFFYLYLPPGSSGVWRIGLISVDCKSPIMDANCRYTGAFTPRDRDVTLPANEVVEFRYFK